MSVNLTLEPKTKRPTGEPCCEPVVYPDVAREQTERMAAVAKALERRGLWAYYYVVPGALEEVTGWLRG